MTALQPVSRVVAPRFMRLLESRTDVSAPTVDDFDHETHMRRAVELAREAADRGDRPFGTVLVRDDTDIMADSNRVITENDIRRHPELHLAYRACRELEPDDRAETVMYTSTEPCPMCAGGMVEAGFERVVYGVGNDELAEFTGREPSVRSRKILDGVSDVTGPVLNEECRRLHREFDW
ncbi:CMP/dCMP deaminase zinc-binding protein [Natrialba aegyptia DSM 13077]|uniref:CMP/dCMP deaminase zinc-binding protein n=2 Tax=Natrialba aegyptia TaxID=129789 RepID=M0APE8_9EURY|nr:CMP/dCMP deaminase zinc-binding protein [Natrialba aegyptia DSM 13077]